MDTFCPADFWAHYVAVKPDSVSVKYEAAKGKWMAMINATKKQLTGI